MRARNWQSSTRALVLAFAAAHAVSCSKDAENCDLGLTCPSYAEPGGADPACQIPPMFSDGAPVAKCGVFAAPGVSGGDGSESTPFGSLQAAIDAAAAAGKPVYACAKEFTEALDVPSGVTIYGGLDCDHDWAWTADLRTVVKPAASATQPGASEIAVRLRAGDEKTTLADIDIIAPDGLMPGVSSIAVLAEDTEAELERCTLTAGDGADGAPGYSLTDDITLNGENGIAGYDICLAGATNVGPAGPVKACGAVSSNGGSGGNGGLPTGTSLDGGRGGDGDPANASFPSSGLGGTGQSTTSCQAGGQGADGALGDSGEGASGKGTITASGYVGVDGGSGIAGTPGQGGGGGGGAKGKTQVQCQGAAASDRPGATGGTGGTGGCGGSEGGGGKAGGSSIAFASLALQAITLIDVGLNVGRGGNGGVGGDGQNGGIGGFGQSGGQGSGVTSNGCHGGDGGHGGIGGPGGGGQGGHAIGIAYHGTAPNGAPAVIFKSSTPSPGKGGAPGTNSNAVNGQGEDGATGDLIQL